MTAYASAVDNWTSIERLVHSRVAIHVDLFGTNWFESIQFRRKYWPFDSSVPFGCSAQFLHLTAWPTSRDDVVDYARLQLIQ